MTQDCKAPRQPMFWAAIALSSGLWVGRHAWRPPSWWLAAIVAFTSAACWFLFARSWLAKALSLGAWFLLGALLIQNCVPQPDDPHLADLADGRAVELTGRIMREGYSRSAGPNAIRESVDLETEEIASQNNRWPIRAGVRLTIFEKEVQRRAHECGGSHVPATHESAEGDTEAENETVEPLLATSAGLSYGSRIRIRAKLHRPRNYRNPGAFDYEGYLRDNGISLLGSADAKDLERLPGFAGSQIQLWRSRVHASIVAKIHQLWPKTQAELMDAMVLGEESFLRNATRTEYQRSGTYHVLVVSGMNLSILAAAIFWTLRQFRVDPAVASIATVVVSFAYAFVVGVGPPVWRSALMLATYLGARLLYRERNMMNAIGAAAVVVLVADPQSLFGASFHLTFLAVFIIAGIGSPILEKNTLPYARGLRLLRATSYDLHVSPAVAQFRVDLRLIAGRLKRFVGIRLGFAIPRVLLRFAIGVAELIFISSLMQAGLALLMAYHFHRATTTGIIANLAVIPLTQVLMPAAAAAVGLGYVSMAVAKPAAWVSGFALAGIAGTVHRMGGAQLLRSSIVDLRVALPTLAMIVVSLTALSLAMLASRRARAAAFGSVGLLFAVAAWIAAFPSHPRFHAGVMEMTAIDVGQGDSILLITPQGRAMLIDAGGLPRWMHSDFDIGEQVVSSYLWNRGIDHLDVVIVTHPHADHLGGMPAVIANFHPQQLWISVDNATGELAPVLSQAAKAGIKVEVKKEGDQFEYGGLHFRVLAPGRDQVTGSMRPNDDCLVFTATFRRTSVLLEGDAERAVEEQVVTEHPEAALLKVAHHGSASATSNELLASVHPRYAVISVGEHNTYGHPRREVLLRLQQFGVKTYRTDEEGAIRFYLDGNSVTPEVMLTQSH